MIGEVIGNFRVVALIGDGGMGEVYVAEHLKIRTRAAIKVLKAECSQDGSLVERFFNEAVAAGKIQHAGVVKISDVGFHGDRAYLIMELLEGESLAARIRRVGPLPLPYVANIGRQIASVLDVMHRAQITHRDLKPDNVFLIADAEVGERVKVLDFGIAKLAGVPGQSITASSQAAMGTAAYMSPEQWKAAKHVDWRTDAYALGCLLCEAATGAPPFGFESFGEACAKHLTEVPPAVSSRVPGTPKAFDKLVARLLAKEPAARPASMREVIDELVALERTPVSIKPAARATPVPAPVAAPTTLGGAAAEQTFTAPPRHRGALIGVAIAGAVACGIGAVAMATRHHGASSPVSGGFDGVSGAGSNVAVADAAPVVVAPAADAGSRCADLTQAGVDAYNRSEWAAALSYFQQAYSCAPSPIVATLAAYAACGASDLENARKWNPLADPAKRAEIAERCSENGIDQGALSGVGGDCDEIWCVEGVSTAACCDKLKHHVKPAAPGTLSHKDIAAGLSTAKNLVVGCGANWPHGQLKVHLTVTPAGAVDSCAVEATTNDAVGDCTCKALQKFAKFATSDNGAAFSYPFAF